MGLVSVYRNAFLVARATPWERVRLHLVAVGAHVGLASAAGWLGISPIGGEASLEWRALGAWLWSAAAVSALACALVTRMRGPGRCFLAAVALAWWIPAVLPPSFLRAVPRALRQLVVGGPETSMPSDRTAWLADTALVAGLLLLAWAPRRATPRRDEVRHPG